MTLSESEEGRTLRWSSFSGTFRRRARSPIKRRLWARRMDSKFSQRRRGTLYSSVGAGEEEEEEEEEGLDAVPVTVLLMKKRDGWVSGLEGGEVINFRCESADGFFPFVESCGDVWGGE